MGSPFVGEIRMFAGNFAPYGWSLCNGAIIPIDQNETLFNLIGTTYGGDGKSNFALPNLQSRVPVHVGTGFQIGQTGGAESVTLNTNQIPSHSHAPIATTDAGNSNSPSNGIWAQSASGPYETANPGNTNMAAMQTTGGSQPHDNMMPFLTINFILSLFGIFPIPS